MRAPACDPTATTSLPTFVTWPSVWVMPRALAATVKSWPASVAGGKPRAAADGAGLRRARPAVARAAAGSPSACTGTAAAGWAPRVTRYPARRPGVRYPAGRPGGRGRAGHPGGRGRAGPPGGRWGGDPAAERDAGGVLRSRRGGRAGRLAVAPRPGRAGGLAVAPGPGRAGSGGPRTRTRAGT